MRDFIEFLGGGFFHAKAESEAKLDSSAAMGFYYQAELSDTKKLVCITKTKLNAATIELLQKIMQAIKAKNLNFVLDIELNDFDYVLIFHEQPDLNIHQGLEQSIVLPDLQAMSQNNELKKLAWQKLKKIFL